MAQDPKNKPYTANYPVLEEWIRKHEARCNWQLPLGDPRRPNGYVESWSTKRGIFLIVVHANQNGWELYTACGNNHIGATFLDAEARLGLAQPPTGAAS